MMSIINPAFDPADANRLRECIHLAWLQLDPDELAEVVPVNPHVQHADLLKYSPLLLQAMQGWAGTYTTSGPGGYRPNTWKEFLDDLRRARSRAAEASFLAEEDARDGLVIHRGILR